MVNNRIPKGGKTPLNPGHDKVQQCFHSFLNTWINNLTLLWQLNYFSKNAAAALVLLF